VVCSLGLLAAGCGDGGPTNRTHATSLTAGRLATWQRFVHVRGVVDLTPPLPGTASIRVAAAGRLETLSGRRLHRFSPDYSAPAGLEPYIAPSSGQRVAGAGCRFPRGALFALRLTDGHGITVVDEDGHVRRFAALHGAGLEDGITFDDGGRFGHRLLATTYAKGVERRCRRSTAAAASGS